MLLLEPLGFEVSVHLTDPQPPSAAQTLPIGTSLCIALGGCPDSHLAGHASHVAAGGAASPGPLCSPRARGPPAPPGLPRRKAAGASSRCRSRARVSPLSVPQVAACVSLVLHGLRGSPQLPCTPGSSDSRQHPACRSPLTPPVPRQGSCLPPSPAQLEVQVRPGGAAPGKVSDSAQTPKKN
jgi:hypothetical protein